MRHSIVFLLFLICFNAIGQQQLISLVICDHDTNKPVENVHAFIVNTTFGTVSDANGVLDLTIPEGITEDLIISHIAFNTQVFIHREYSRLQKGDTIYLLNNGLSIAELTVTAERSNKWKRRYKKFKKAFLGDDKVADKCEILNQEVIRFEERNGILSASAIDFIKIDNPFLGYTIDYLLTSFKIEDDGSSEYSGRGRFLDLSVNNQSEEITENRENLYRSSSKHFFKSMVDDRLDEEGYEVFISFYEDGVFKDIKAVTREDLISKAPDGINYQVRFPEFLKVVDKNQKSVEFYNVSLRPGGLESSRFAGSVRAESADIQYATSYLYKVSKFLLLNQHGNVLNTHQVKEYGVWAEQRMAQQLPFDYGNNYESIGSLPKDTLDDPNASGSQLSTDDKVIILISLLYDTEVGIKEETIASLRRNWEDGFIAPLLEVLRFVQDPLLESEINTLLQEKTGSDAEGFYEWVQWIWQKSPKYDDYYTTIKAMIYENIDPAFRGYFLDRSADMNIRLDEVLWGGVKQDGIPPLRYPEMLDVEMAGYLDDSDIVFGMYINGQARAYPKRILAWHEFVVDTFGDTKVAGVYCTLCGTVIAYDMTHDGQFHDLGTSGFLYRSNKLMYDKTTQSLWSTIEGKPVIGQLADKGIELTTYPVVTTTWGEWRTLHPDTKVLSIVTGHQREYSEGAAYEDYFATDELMFPVPDIDSRLKNKDEVLIVRMDGYENDPLAISIKFLRKKKWYQGEINGRSFIAVADRGGAARAYESDDVTFDSFSGDILIDEEGRKWYISEEALTSEDGRTQSRIAAHNIFWFAWSNAYPGTRLVD